MHVLVGEVHVLVEGFGLTMASTSARLSLLTTSSMAACMRAMGRAISLTLELIKTSTLDRLISLPTTSSMAACLLACLPA